MPAKKTTKKTSQVMDVSKPGKTAPSSSSRPIILGHKPPVQDPMVNEDKKMPSNESEEHKIDVKRTGPKVIAPLSPTDSLVAAKDAETPQEKPDVEAATEDTTAVDQGVGTEVPEESEVPEVPVDETPEEESAEEPTEEPTKMPKEEKKDSKDKGSSIVDAIAGQAAKNKDKKDDKKTQELQKRLAEIEKLVDDKKYFVRTSNTTKKERKTRWAVLLLALLLLVAGYLVVDAQLVKNDYWLPYHFFKEEKKDKDTASNPPTTQSNNQTDGQKQDESEKEAYTGMVVESTKKAFSLKVPDGWKIRLIKSNDGLYSEFAGGDIDSFLEYKTGTKPVVVTQDDLGTDGPIRFNINYYDLAEDVPVVDGTYAKTEFTTDAGVKGSRYFKQIPLDMEGELGPSPAEKRYVYEFKTATQKFYITYRILEKTEGKEDGLTKSDKNRLELVENVVKTFVIK